VPRRTTGDNSGAELRAWLLAEQMEIYEAVTAPPQVPIDGRPPTQVDPAVGNAIAEAMAGFWRPLAEGKAHQLCRRDLRRIILPGVWVIWAMRWSSPRTTS
jgi:hypothetical protein